MDSSFHALPPLKRFRLMQAQAEEEATKSSLPAKKRKQYPDSDSSSPPPPPPCLPAKKRVWAIQPFDLNLDYNELEVQNLDCSNSAEEAEEEDDGIVCAVCGSTDGDPTDPIVFCDGCDLMVHTTCYGQPFTRGGIPQGDWFCAKCLAASSEISCCLCPVSGGALKPTTDGKWAHLVCAIYVPEVYFEDPEGREGIVCGKVLNRRWKKDCCVCRFKKGCAIDCSEPKCELGFHVSCGVKEGLSIEYRQGKNKAGVVAAFCRAHTDLWKKQEQTGKFKIVARDEH